MKLFSSLPILLISSMALLTCGISHVSDPAPQSAPGVVDNSLNSAAIRTISTIRFEENVGQFAEGVLYAARMNGGLIAFLRDEVVYVRTSHVRRDLSSNGKRMGYHRKGRPGLLEREDYKNDVAILRVRFDGARAGARPQGVGLRDEVIHIAKCMRQSNSAKRAMSFDTIMYKNLYPGIDLRFRALRGQVKYEFIVHPGADPTSISLRYITHDSVEFTENGGLDACVGKTHFVEAPPILYQLRGGQASRVLGKFMLHDATVVGFKIDEYSQDFDLIIDPTISTYLGGSGLDTGGNILVSAAGNIIISGRSDSPDFPITQGVFDQSSHGGRDAYIAVLSPDGRRLLHATYFGGRGDEYAACMAMDAQQNILIAGYTTSDDLPTTESAYQNVPQGSQDGYIAMFDSTLSTLRLCTYLGGSGYDDLLDMTLDPEGNICVTGLTDSRDFPRTFGVYQYFYGGGEDDIFVLKLTSDGSRLRFGTYIGGNDFDEGWVLRSDRAGNLCIGGMTDSYNFPTTLNAFKPRRLPERVDQGFIALLSCDGRQLLYSTYVGGSNSDYVMTLALDDSNYVYCGGLASSSDFPTTKGVVQEASDSSGSGFVAKVSLTTGSLIWATCIGGIYQTDITCLALLSEGKVIVSGWTKSPNLPVTFNAYQPLLAGISNRDIDGIITVLDSSASKYVYSSYYGGSEWDYFWNCKIVNNRIYLCGNTLSRDFPTTTGCFQPIKADTTDAMIVVFPIDEILTGLSQRRPASTEKSFSLQVFPNPATGPALQVQYTLDAYGAVAVRVSDINGRVLRESIAVHFAPGVYRRTFDVTQLPPGMYLYSVEAFGRRESGKFVR